MSQSAFHKFLNKASAKTVSRETLTPLERNREKIMRTLWWYQEEDRLGFPGVDELCFLSRLPPKQFKRALDSLLLDENPCVIRCQDGRIAYEW